MRLDADMAVQTGAGWLSLDCLKCNLPVGVAVAGG